MHHIFGHDYYSCLDLLIFQHLNEIEQGTPKLTVRPGNVKSITIIFFHLLPYRRLRDRFIEDERLSLAMEISTKCGLEPSSVWAASGFACLQAGDFAAAREKFAMCMKVRFPTILCNCRIFKILKPLVPEVQSSTIYSLVPDLLSLFWLFHFYHLCKLNLASNEKPS